MEHAIAITRSQLRQVIEDYIAASRVGDTLSYVETAKLSTAEAAESSTARIWEGLCSQDESLIQPSVSRVLDVLERQVAVIKAGTDDLAKRRDYSAEFRADDLAALERAHRIVLAFESCGTVVMDEPVEPAQEFVCVEDLAAGQVVIINSRGMIEGKRDDNDALVVEPEAPTETTDDFF